MREDARKRMAKRRLKPGVIEDAREYRLARIATRDEFLANYKMSRGCVDCGYKGHPRALDFDHLSNKSFTIGGKGREKEWKQLLAEIEKCEVVCSNCHRIRTHNREQEKKVGQLADALLSA
jgi:hypothetical protein